MNKRINWGILATGYIAGRFAEGLAGSRLGKLRSVASRSHDKAKDFALKHSADSYYSNYEDLISDPNIDCIYLATPHPSHAKIAVQILEAGKHCLCEKPICMNSAELTMVADAAKTNRRLVMEAFMYRCHPQIVDVIKRIQAGAIGQISCIRSSFSFHAGFDPDNRLFNKKLGGGGILDVGGYPLSFARLIAGVADDKSFLDPVELRGFARLHPQTGVDTFAIASLEFENGILAQLSCGTQLAQENEAMIYGSEGYISIPEPWVPTKSGDWSFTIHTDQENSPEIVSGHSNESVYSLEADHFAQLIRGETPLAPGMSIEDSIGQASAIDRWLKEAKVSYK